MRFSIRHETLYRYSGPVGLAPHILRLNPRTEGARVFAACRSLGIAARFVSGYQAHAESQDGRRHLHAWPEVFLPGLGWRGFDATHGTVVNDGHVALCAAPEQSATMPIEGGFFGDGITAALDYHVQIASW